MTDIISRTAAKRDGLKTYFSGNPCKNGHVAERYVRDTTCTSCCERFTGKRGGKRAGSGRYTDEERRERYLQKKYGLTQQAWLQMFEDQGGCCAICHRDEPGLHGKWHTDHCHSRGKLRSILCGYCNVALGSAQDSVSTLKSMIAYLERHGDAQKRDWLCV